MRCLSIAFVSAIIPMLSGCMYCENGLCSPGEQEAIFDPSLLGEWVPVNPKPEKGEEGYFKVERDDPASNAYRITAITFAAAGKPKVDPFVFKAYLGKFGEFLFFDVLLTPEPGRRGESPRHEIWSAEIKMPEVTVRALSEDFIKRHPDSLRRTVERSPLGLDAVTVTATTRQLADFVRKHARDDAVWGKPAVLRREDQADRLNERKDAKKRNR